MKSTYAYDAILQPGQSWTMHSPGRPVFLVKAAATVCKSCRVPYGAYLGACPECPLDLETGEE